MLRSNHRTGADLNRIGQFVLFNGIGIAVAFGVAAIVIQLAHGSPAAALAALRYGAWGTPYNLGSSVTKAVPLLLTGLGVSIAFRAKLWNLGGEGQLILGALSSAAIGAYWLKNGASVIVIPLELIAGMLAGAFWSGIAGLMKTWRGVPEVISTIMLNFVAAELLSYLLHGPLQESTHSQPATEELRSSLMLPNIIPNTPVHAGVIVAVVCVVLCYVYLFRTRAGFDLKLVGANELAARTAGINITRVKLVTMLISGALCGLAGAVEYTGVLGTLYENWSPGYGFAAVAVGILGQLHPGGIVLAALFFGALNAGSGTMERAANVSSVLVNVVQGSCLISLMIAQYYSGLHLPWRRPKPRDTDGSDKIVVREQL